MVILETAFCPLLNAVATFTVPLLLARVEIKPKSALLKGLLEDPKDVLDEQLNPCDPSNRVHLDLEKSPEVKRMDEHCAGGRHPEFD